jgi:hypothetical protein
MTTWGFVMVETEWFGVMICATVSTGRQEILLALLNRG